MGLEKHGPGSPTLRNSQAMDLSRSQQDVSPASSWVSLAMKELL